MNVGVLFSHDGILALNKPPGMCSQGPKTSDIPEVWELVRMYHPEGHVVHRIDRFTSGVNLVGASRRQIRYLMMNWHEITRKSYLAIIRNPAWNERTVSTPIGGKSATTAFTVLERCGVFALVRCELVQNGRTHQIRRHLKSIGCPIVGDCKYGGSRTNARAGQLLHAWRLEVRLPDEAGNPSSSWTTIQAPIPDDFKRFGFNWSRWDVQANVVSEVWPVPSGWRQTPLAA